MIFIRIAKKYLTVDQLAVREDLKKQLILKGLTQKFYDDLLEDYMYMLVQKDKLQKDINEHGVRIMTVNSKGLSIEKKNESYDLLLKYNQQMIKLLEYLGIKPSENILGDEDDEL